MAAWMSRVAGHRIMGGPDVCAFGPEPHAIHVIANLVHVLPATAGAVTRVEAWWTSGSQFLAVLWQTPSSSVARFCGNPPHITRAPKQRHKLAIVPRDTSLLLHSQSFSQPAGQLHGLRRSQRHKIYIRCCQNNTQPTRGQPCIMQKATCLLQRPALSTTSPGLWGCQRMAPPFSDSTAAQTLRTTDRQSGEKTGFTSDHNCILNHRCDECRRQR